MNAKCWQFVLKQSNTNYFVFAYNKAFTLMSIFVLKNESFVPENVIVHTALI